MRDKFGNPLAVGDTVVYFSTDIAKTSRIGIIRSLEGGSVKLLTQSNREITRGPSTLIHYTGVLP
jgi:hypothetical protein